jgi:sn-glycerol 3-phosphate transport system permease protein
VSQATPTVGDVRPKGLAAWVVSRPRRISRWFSQRGPEAGLGYLLILPALAVFGVFTFFPFLENFDIAARTSPPYSYLPHKLVWFHQFQQTIFTSTFLSSLEATAIFVGISVPLGLFLGLALAVFANQKLRGMAIFQVIFSSTAVTSVAVAGVIFYTILSPSNGIVQSLGINLSPGIQSSPGWAIYAVAGVSAWQVLGFSFILMIAGLQSMPEEVIEASRIDGATAWKSFWRVIVPLMSPTIFFAGVIGTIVALQNLGTINILIGGQGQEEFTHTQVLIAYLYNLLSVPPANYGAAACVSIALFGITLLATVVQFRVLERRVHYGA